MAHRLFLHIGPPKTGTTFLQAAWFDHRHEMAEQGVLYPGAKRLDQFRASAVVVGKTRVTKRMPPGQLSAWQRLTDEIRDWDGDAILSSEHYAYAPRSQAQEVLDLVADLCAEVHLVVTVRDLVRLVPAAWQQSIKQGNDETFDDYWRRLAAHRTSGFWRAQDLPRMLDRWTESLPPERVHLVVHGAPGSPRNLLWERTCAVTGVDPSILGPGKLANESLGVSQIEFLRRVNAALPADRDRLDMGRMTKSFVTKKLLVDNGPAIPVALPEPARQWLTEVGQEAVAQLQDRDYDIVGDLEDLLPSADNGRGRTPDSVSDADVAAVASEAFARLLVHELDRRGAERRLKDELRRLRRQVQAATAGPQGITARVRRQLGRRRRSVAG